MNPMSEEKINLEKAENIAVQAQEVTLEQAFLRLNDILAELDSGKQSLEEAFASYAQGMEMIRLCNAKIDKVEKQCLVISESGDDHEF